MPLRVPHLMANGFGRWNGLSHGVFSCLISVSEMSQIPGAPLESEFGKFTVTLNMARSAKGRLNLKLCRSSSANKVTSIRLCVVRRPFTAFVQGMWLLTILFLTWIPAMHLFCSKQLFTQAGSGEVAGLLICSRLCLFCWQRSWFVLGLFELICHNCAMPEMRFSCLSKDLS